MGTGFSNMYVPSNINNVSGAIYIGVNTGAVMITSQQKTDNTQSTSILTGNLSAAVANAGSGRIFISTGNVTNPSALSSQFSASVRIDSGTVDGSATRGGLVIFNGNAEPTWNGLQRGIFIGNATAVPTGDPTGGGFLYVEGGALKWRGSSGTVTTIATA